MKRFKTYIFALLIAGFMLPFIYAGLYYTLLWIGLPIQKIPYQALYDYQMQKAENSDAETIFVGDSALGYAINAQEFSKISGENTENYALTGKFGYKGSSNTIQSVLNSNPNLKTVIIMQVADMITRAPAKDYKPAPKILGINTDIFNFKTLQMITFSIFENSRAQKHKKSQIVNDYIEQSKNPSEILPPSLSTAQINDDKLQVLKDIQNICKESGLNCIYAHAPLVAPACQNPDFFEATRKRISETGLTVAEQTPICIPKNQLGDAPDHVAPPHKNSFTRQYYEVLKPYL